ncbi:MAG: hypothetical protein A2Y95_05420 [Deltaproteobacteria bacterium RBG_13_65_10]|nr:MAG: hypothetical protein A2Y95_05420 [Deltaproteobacteria bacterium RBG_13_65_10]
MGLDEPKRLFLRTGDHVYHLNYRGWGTGRVVEVMTSTLPGGGAFVRVIWNDGKKRVFNNDFDHYQCCYYFGVRLCEPEARRPAIEKPSRRRLAAPGNLSPDPSLRSPNTPSAAKSASAIIDNASRSRGR